MNSLHKLIHQHTIQPATKIDRADREFGLTRQDLAREKPSLFEEQPQLYCDSISKTLKDN